MTARSSSTNTICPRTGRGSRTHFFSFQPRGYDLSQLIPDEDYDAINVHWSNQLLNPETAAPLIALGKPVVFTLHDISRFRAAVTIQPAAMVSSVIARPARR